MAPHKTNDAVSTKAAPRPTHTNAHILGKQELIIINDFQPPVSPCSKKRQAARISKLRNESVTESLTEKFFGN